MILGLLLGSHLATAAPVLSIEALLRQPLEARVKQLNGLDSRRLFELEKIAFDAKASLELRWRAITTMGRLDAAPFAPTLERALKSPEWFVRNAALVALLSFDRETAVRASTNALDDPSLMVRTQAVRNLIHFDARTSEPKLWRALANRRNFSPRGESLWIRAHIAEALAKFASGGRTRAFGKMLDDEDDRLHRWAVRGLETCTGLRLTDESEDVAEARRKWRARLGDETI